MPRYALLLTLMLFAACSPTPEPTPVAMTAPNRLINFWQTVSDTPNAAFDAQPYQFVAAENDSIRLRLETSSAGITLSLLAPGGATLDGGNDIRAALPTDGIYTALVRMAPGETTSYTLTLEYTDRPDPSKPTETPTITPTPRPTRTPTDTPTPTPVYAALGDLVSTLTSGVPIDGTIDLAGAQEVYLFTGEAGQFASLEMTYVSGSIDPVVTLYDPQGKPLAMDDNSGGGKDAYLRNIRLPAAGEYSAQIGGDGGTGDYQLALRIGSEREPVTPLIPQPTATVTPTVTPEARPDRLVDHVPVPGRIDRSGGFVRYPIVAQVGDVFTIGVVPAPNSALEPRVELYNPDGELVETADVDTTGSGGGAVIAAYTALDSGTYLALVQDEGNGDGDFVIGYGLGASYDTVMRGEAAPEVSVPGEVPSRGLRDVWRVLLNRDDVITVTANPASATFDPALEIVAPDGTVIASDDNGGGGRVPVINSLRIPESGYYTVNVIGANAGSAGVYTLLWRYVVVGATPTPPAASVLLLSADSAVPQQTYLFYPFQGFAGQRIFIRVLADRTTDLDPVLALLDGEGNVLASADDNGTDLNPVLEFQLPADGTYTVRINGYGESNGLVSLTVEALF